MEVAVHQNQEFQFNSTATSPYGSPRRFGNPFDLHFHYTSAPSSPARAAAIYAHFNSAAAMAAAAAAATTAATASPAPALPPPIPTPRPSSAIPFEWEEKPGTPKCASRASTVDSSDAFDFVFDFSRQLNKEGPLPVADDIFFEDHPSAAARAPRPLKPPPRLHRPISSSSPDHALLDGAGARSAAGAVSSPRSPRTLKGLWSPRGRGGVGEEFDPFTAAMVEATRDRGRDRSSSAAVAASPSFSSPSRLRNKGSSRSLSPRPLDRSGGEVVLGTGLILPPAAAPAASAAPGTASKGGGGGGRRWRLRDLLLFRSASEGRVTGSRRSKDPMRKFSFLTSSHSSSSLLSPFCSKKLLGGVNEEEWRRDLSFRSIDSSSGDQAAAVSSSADVDADAAGGAGRAASKEGKKKNGGLPPYGQGIFSCIRFNPTICNIARGVGSASFARR